MDCMFNGASKSLVETQYGAEGLKLLKAIYWVCGKGSDAEVRRNSDGTYKVYEVKKRIAG